MIPQKLSPVHTIFHLPALFTMKECGPHTTPYHHTATYRYF